MSSNKIIKQFSILFFLYYALSIPSVNAKVVCSDAFGKFFMVTKDIVSSIKNISRNGGLSSSSLSSSDGIRILSSTYSSKKDFMKNHIKGKRVLEIGNSGFTHLLDNLKVEGAKDTLGIDLLELKPGENKKSHLVLDINELTNKIEEVKRKLSGELPDTIFAISIFGAISYKYTEKWLKILIENVNEEGFIFVDFLLYEAWRPNRGMSKEEFEGLLNKLKGSNFIKTWEAADDPVNVDYLYRGVFELESRVPSLTYKIAPYKKTVTAPKTEEHSSKQIDDNSVSFDWQKLLVVGEKDKWIIMREKWADSETDQISFERAFLEEMEQLPLEKRRNVEAVYSILTFDFNMDLAALTPQFINSKRSDISSIYADLFKHFRDMPIMHEQRVQKGEQAINDFLEILSQIE